MTRQTEWISVREALPKCGYRFLVTVKSKYHPPFTSIARYYTGIWTNYSERVTHWMPLPEPMEGES